MKEISYYEEFSKKFSRYLETYLGNAFKIYYSCNNNLDILIKDLEVQSNTNIRHKNSYIPKLKVDIVFAICSNKSSKLILIEAKYLPQLSLKDYSQLTGYLQVAKNIELGLLLLIQKGNTINKLSTDFQEILRLKKLPMDWLVDLKQLDEKYNFKTGIISYVPNNGIDWVDSKEIHGISSFEALAEIIKANF
jgi:hypothetical protein